jgi:hypothetical protein
MDRLKSIPDRDLIKPMREHQNPHQKDEVSIPERDFKAQDSALALRPEFYNNYYLVFMKILLLAIVVNQYCIGKDILIRSSYFLCVTVVN